MHFTSKWDRSLARGSNVQMGSSMPYSSFHPWSIGFLTRIMALCAVTHILAWKTLLLICWCKVSLVGGFLSPFLVFFARIISFTRGQRHCLDHSSKTGGQSWLPLPSVLVTFEMERRWQLQILPLVMTLRPSTYSSIAYPWTWRKTCCLIQCMHDRGPLLDTWSFRGLRWLCSMRSFW